MYRPFFIIFSFLFLTITEYSFAQEHWWQRERLSPSENQIINPKYLEIKRKLEIEWDNLQTLIKSERHFRSMGQKTTSLQEAIYSSKNKVNQLENTLSHIPQYLTRPRERHHNHNYEGYTSQTSLDLTSPNPQISNLEFKYQGAGYDYNYKNHWLINSLNGYIEVGFNGNRSFSFHALGSTINRISYCYIDIYINNQLYNSHEFIDKDWQYYQLPANLFSSGWNNVKIVLKGNTHLWIDEIELQ